MENLNLHKQKLYALIAAGVSLVSLLLPWITWGGLTLRNGFSKWGLITLIGIAVVAFACFMGDKAKEFDMNTKKIAMAGFAAIALGGIITFVTKGSYGGGYGYARTSFNVGFGVWLAIIAGLAGLAWVAGLIKLPAGPKPPSPPPPPM